MGYTIVTVSSWYFRSLTPLDNMYDFSFVVKDVVDYDLLVEDDVSSDVLTSLCLSVPSFL